MFGVEAAQWCLCGNTLANNLASAAPGDCSIPCGGNTQLLCGANWRINIYSSTVQVDSATQMNLMTQGCLNNTSSGGLSLSDQIALGVGLGLGIPTLILTAFMCLRQYREAKGTATILTRVVLIE